MGHSQYQIVVLKNAHNSGVISMRDTLKTKVGMAYLLSWMKPNKFEETKWISNEAYNWDQWRPALRNVRKSASGRALPAQASAFHKQNAVASAPSKLVHNHWYHAYITCEIIIASFYYITVSHYIAIFV